MDTINYKVPVEYQQINNFLSAKDSVRDDDAEQSVHLTGGESAPLEALSTPQPDSGFKAGTTPPTSK